MAAWTQADADQAVKDVMIRAQTDKGFRDLCLSNPHEAIEQIAGKAVPDSLKLKVLESDPDFDLTVVLPLFMGEELSDRELDQVAGGDCKGNAAACIVGNIG